MSQNMAHPRVVLGTGSSFGSPEVPDLPFNTAAKAQAALDLFRQYGHNEVDTARQYPTAMSGTSELMIGQTNVKDWGLIDTKVWSFPKKHMPEAVAQSVKESLEALQTEKLHILYFHWPDRETPLEDALKGMNDLYQLGKFEKLGISNYSIDEVKQMMEICDKRGFVKPSVYQGSYSAVARRAEAELLPLLRKHNISFYAYSPAAGGIFSKSSSRMNSQTPIGDYYRATFGSSGMSAALANANRAAEAAGIDGHALALRWVLHHSALKAEHGDAMIVGASRLEQLEKTLKICEAGPLPQNLVNIMEEVWQEALPTAPSYSPWVKMEGVPDHTATVNNYIEANKK